MLSSTHRTLATLALLALAACGGDPAPEPPPDLMTREAFVEVYVELRLAALVTGTQTPTPQARNAALARFQVQPEALFDFIEFHGRDVDYMRGLWDEVEAIVDSRRNSSLPDPSMGVG
jgi:hypothetical protein